MNTLLGWFWRGCLVLVPIVVILYAGYVVVTTFDRLVPLGIPGLGFVVAVLAITFVGFMSSNVIGRAVAAGCPALILTADLPVQGQRHRDLKNGLTVPPKLTVANLLDMALTPRWALGMLGAKGRSLGNLAG